MDLTISIVSYNTEGLIKRCLNSIFKYTKDIKFEVIVVDNGSSDKTREIIKKEFPKVLLIENKKNLFFTKANNQALQKAKGKYFLILNSDTYFVDNSLKKMVDFMEKNKEIGACEGLEIYENGKIMNTGSKLSTPLIDFFELSLIGKRLKNKRIVEEYRYSSIDRRKIFPIDVACDAFLIVRKEILDKIKGYDENFLLYYTENDLCLRIKNLGYKIVHNGNIKLIHKVSASTNQLKWEKLNIYYKDLLFYYKKHGYLLSGYVLFFLLSFEKILLRIFRPKMFN